MEHSLLGTKLVSSKAGIDGSLSHRPVRGLSLGIDAGCLGINAGCNGRPLDGNRHSSRRVNDLNRVPKRKRAERLSLRTGRRSPATKWHA